MRASINKRSNSKIPIAVFAATTILICGLGWSVRQMNFSNVSADMDSVRFGGMTFNSSSDGPTVVLMGDSNAGMYGGVLKDLAHNCNFKLNVLSIHSTNPFPGGKLWNRSVEFVKETNPDVVIFVCGWGGSVTTVRDTVPDGVRELKSHTKALILVAQPPILPEGVNRDQIRKSGLRDIVESQLDKQSRELARKVVADQRETQSVYFVPTEDLFLNPIGNIQFLDKAGRQNFRDRTHLSYAGASQVAERIKNLLQQIFLTNTAELQ